MTGLSTSTTAPKKIATEIEREQHVKFCEEQPTVIDRAVQSCQNAALGYFSYFIKEVCPQGGGQWIFNFKLTDKINIGGSGAMILSADLRAGAGAEKNMLTIVVGSVAIFTKMP